MQRSNWLSHELMSDDERRRALSHELGVPFVRLEPVDISLEALVLVPEPLAREHSIVAYALGERGVEVALLDLDDLVHLESLRTKHRLLPRLTTRESMTRALVRYQQHLRDRYGKALERADSPNLLDALLRHALVSNATDVHLQSDEHGLLIRYRINGVLRSALTLPMATGGAVVEALRELGNLPTGALPKESRVRIELDTEAIAVRIAAVPIAGGEKLTLHLVRDQARRGWSLETLGLHGEGLERVHAQLLKRRGLVVVSGTGTTTMAYTMLDMLNTPEISIATVEQSVEHTLKRVAQTDVGATGLSTAAALRAALRQDPDVVMIDAVTDEETATLTAAAAKRGVLVIAVVTSADRLPNADLHIRCAVVRKLCTKHLGEQAKLLRAEQDELERLGADFANVLATLKEEGRIDKNTAWKELQFPRATGCSECQSGYQGRLGIQEVAAAGSKSLNIVEDALYKAAQGLTTIEEVQGLG